MKKELKKGKNSKSFLFIALLFFTIFIISLIAGNINLYSPINGTVYSTNLIDLNWTTNTSLSWCAYSLNGGVNNTSLCQNFVKLGAISNTSSMQGSIDSFISGDYAYVSSYTKDALTIINVSDKTNPVQISSLVDSTYLDGAWGVYVDGNYAYVTSILNSSVSVINVSDFTVSPPMAIMVDDMKTA